MSTDPEAASRGTGSDVRAKSRLDEYEVRIGAAIYEQAFYAVDPFMAGLAQGLAERQVATLRYQFPFVENGAKRPDTAAVAHATVRAAVA